MQSEAKHLEASSIACASQDSAWLALAIQLDSGSLGFARDDIEDTQLVMQSEAKHLEATTLLRASHERAWLALTIQLDSRSLGFARDDSPDASASSDLVMQSEAKHLEATTILLRDDPQPHKTTISAE